MSELKQPTLDKFFNTKRPPSQPEGPETRSHKKLKSEFFDKKTDVSVTKHNILSKYLGAWLAIHSQNPYRAEGKHKTCPQYTRIVYVDGFAGPGFYSSGKDRGSPAVAYELALTHKRLKAEVEIYMIFIEKKQALCHDLLKNLTKLKNDHKSAINVGTVKFMIINAEFVKAMEWILSNRFCFPLNSRDKFFTVPGLFRPCEEAADLNLFITNQTSFFVFVDPFGYNGEKIPMTLMQKILKSSQKAEVLTNLMTGFIHRFNAIENREKAINLLIENDGSNPSWKTLVRNGNNVDEKIKIFLDLYYKNISEVVSGDVYPTLFEMKDKRNKLFYHLFHVSRHESGFFRMKVAMRHNSQSDYNFQYSSFHANRSQFQRECVDMDKLEQDIIKHFSGDDFKDEYILGCQITDFINRDSNLYQRYKVALKKRLEKYLVQKDVNIHRVKFDGLFFKFLDFQKPSPLYSILN